ncbi:MAG: arginine repressor [Clostridiales bacterium]|nr:arginine repressor [Clostridiales bacterium]
MKQKRHEKILTIIKEKPITTQEELVSELNKVGFKVTQATVSRDIKELKLVKVQSDSAYHYAASIPRAARGYIIPKYSAIIRETIVNMDNVNNLVVVHCHSGMANAAAEAIDVSEMPSVVGTIAGDNTFLVVLRTEEDSITFMEELRNIVNS